MLVKACAYAKELKNILTDLQARPATRYCFTVEAFQICLFVEVGDVYNVLSFLGTINKFRVGNYFMF